MAPVKRGRKRAQEIIRQAKSNVAGLIHLFEAEDLPGKTPKARMNWILWLTASDLPGMQMGLFPPEDSGFREELADGKFYENPQYWADYVPRRERSTKQMGHFLTAVGLRMNRWPDWITLNLIVGHEKLGDRLFFGFVRQFAASSHADRQRFLKAVELDRAADARGRDEELRAIFGTSLEALPDPHRIGNSIVDLRLSVKGWRFGDEIKNGQIRTCREAADWLRREVFDPKRVRHGKAPAGGQGVPDL